jgi:uncharacterized membrane-anchored protein YjiN (DUF445 family)
MTLPATFTIDSPGDAARAAELRRGKWLATGVLAATFALFLAARVLLHVHPIFGFIAAFAEAATIGGLADWYAVVALFKRPLGLPIPHTAIIQSNQHRIADKLGEFIERNFLEAGPVEAKLREIDFGAFVADWLRDRKRSGDLARFALRLLPEAFSATETSGLMTFISRRVTTQLLSIDLAPLAAGPLRGFVPQGGIRACSTTSCAWCIDADASRDHGCDPRQSRAEMPTLLKLYRADRFVVNRIVASATKFFEEVRDDPNHPFRGEFDRMLLSFVERLGSDQAFADRINGLKRDLLARPELGNLARNIWSNVQTFIERSASGESQVLQQLLTRMFTEAGEALAGDADLRAEINQGLVAVLRTVIAEQKNGVSTFISDQMKAWDMRQLISLLEINVGKDLQYIRFNGSLIGGLAGLALYTLEYLLRLL